ncbi:MAG TPA: ABC transporter permease [Xanthomonadaceae bacterium]|nr:ABC transporter permease [Xanthomonadaceae bacterium]HRY00496.1 ABC transporter permease [Xanthomonadaceae bacterium]
MKARRLFAIIVKELRQLARDRMTVAMMMGIPTLQLLLFGFAINLDVRGLQAGIVDQAQTTQSREILQAMLATGVVEPVAEAATPHELMDMVRRGEISVGIVVPPDLTRRLAEGREAVQVLVDGSDTSVQQAARQLSQMPLGNLHRPLPSPRRGAASESPVSLVSFYNPERRSSVSVVPGLIGVILTMTMVLFTAVAIVRERERGNLEMLITTPLSRGELMVGKVLPYVGIGLVQTTVVLLLGLWLFAVPIRGSVVDVYLAALLLIVANLGLGLLISTGVKSQMQAMQLAFFVFLPSILLSGFMFPFAGMPKPAQWLAEILPLTHFVRLIRGIMLRGAQLHELWIDAAALGVFTLVVMSLAILRFRKRLD